MKDAGALSVGSYVGLCPCRYAFHMLIKKLK